MLKLSIKELFEKTKELKDTDLIGKACPFYEVLKNYDYCLSCPFRKDSLRPDGCNAYYKIEPNTRIEGRVNYLLKSLVKAFPFLIDS